MPYASSASFSAFVSFFGTVRRRRASRSPFPPPFSFGAPASYTLNQWLGVAFAQDTYRVNNDLTLDLGLRYDRQSISTAKGCAQR